MVSSVHTTGRPRGKIGSGDTSMITRNHAGKLV